MDTKMILVFALVAVTSLVDCRPTHCERWKGDKEYRCAKDDYKSDYVTVRNRGEFQVSFGTGIWLSPCGTPGQKYAGRSYNLSPGESVEILFGEVGPGSCNELFVHDCKVGFLDVDCLEAVTVSAN